jgi:multiple sugar transport system ATP-binding protein
MHNLVSVRVENANAQPMTIRVLLPIDQHWEDNQITLALPPEDIHWFDAKTGDRLES